MTPQVTNRKEGGLTSCRGCSRQFSAFTQKELEAVREAQKLIGAPGYWREECLGREWWWRELKESNKPSCRMECTKKAQKMGGFLHLLT
jgi:hypothetical protein